MSESVFREQISDLQARVDALGRHGPIPAWAGALANQLTAIQNTQGEILKMSTSNNAVISKLQNDFAQFSGDFGKFLTDFGTFSENVSAFIASVEAEGSQTVLSPADAAALQALDAQLEGLDAKATAADASLSSITVPATPVPSA